MTIGERIKARRESLGMSQVALADSVNEIKQTIYKYENNIVTNIPISKISLIAKQLNVTPAYLMGWETSSESYSKVFRENISSILSSGDFDLTEQDAQSEYDKVLKVSEKAGEISLSEACEVADLLGESLDSLVGFTKAKPVPSEGDRLSLEIMNLFFALSEEKQQEALHYLRYLATNEETK